MRFLVLLAAILGCVAATCLQDLCNTQENKGLLPSELSYDKRFSPENIRKSSIRWGKRAPVTAQRIRESSRFWGKRDIADSIRRASIRWGKRSSDDLLEFLPPGDLIYPQFEQKPVSPWDGVYGQPPMESEPMHRVTKAEALRPKLALSSRLWGR